MAQGRSLHVLALQKVDPPCVCLAFFWLVTAVKDSPRSFLLRFFRSFDRPFPYFRLLLLLLLSSSSSFFTCVLAVAAAVAAAAAFAAVAVVCPTNRSHMGRFEGQLSLRGICYLRGIWYLRGSGI